LGPREVFGGNLLKMGKSVRASPTFEPNILRKWNKILDMQYNLGTVGLH